MINSENQQTPERQPRPLMDLLISIVIPSVILMNFSGEEDLGVVKALVIALAFPLSWGLLDLVKHREFNFIAILGLFSVLLTGGIGLLQLDVKWLAIKEAAIPAVIGLVILGSTLTRKPLIKALVYNPGVLDVAKIQHKLEARGLETAFEKRLLKATYLLSGTFGFSALMNYLLAKWIVTSPSGSTAFNEELGRMTLLSYPVIVIPSMIMLMAIFYYLWRTIQGMTGLSLEEILSERLK